MAGIDFAWPTYAKVATVTVRKPEAQIDRAADGKIRLRELLVAEPEGGAAPPAPEPVKDAKAEAKDAKTAKTAKTAKEAKPKPKVDASVPPEAQAKGGAVGFPLDVGAFVIEDGHIRFLDRAVKPPFSETISRLAVRVENLSSTPGTRARLTSQAIVGGDAALDIHGELAPLGQLYADLTGELRGFTLASVNPYADSAVAWVVEKGKLGVKFHVKIENNQIDLTDEIAVENIHVTPSREDDEVKKRVGLPLGLIVALITDADNSLKINLPVSGELDKLQGQLQRRDLDRGQERGRQHRGRAVPGHRPALQGQGRQDRVDSPSSRSPSSPAPTRSPTAWTSISPRWPTSCAARPPSVSRWRLSPALPTSTASRVRS